MRARKACLAIAASALIAACGKPPPPSVMPNADAALDRMRATFACVNGVSGTTKIDTFSPQGRVRGEMHLVVLNADRVRFDVVSPFGVTLFTLASNGRDFTMLDLGQKTFFYGPATPENLARLTQVPVPGHALVSILRGEAPVLAHTPEGARVAWDSDGYYRVLLDGKNSASQEIHLEVRPDDWQRPWSEQRMRVLDVRVAQAGVDLYRVELRHHEPAQTARLRVDPDGLEEPIPPTGGPCTAELPRSIRMRAQSSEQDVILQYKKAEWNPPIVPGAFTQPVPGGVQRVYVGPTRR
jgi:hypothetical protein